MDYLVYCRRAACRCTSCRQWTTRPLLLSRPIEYTTKTAAWACDKTQGVTKRTADTCDNCSSSFDLAAVRSFCFCCHYHWVFVYAKTKTVADLPLALESSCTKKGQSTRWARPIVTIVTPCIFSRDNFHRTGSWLWGGRWSVQMRSASSPILPPKNELILFCF